MQTIRIGHVIYSYEHGKVWRHDGFYPKHKTLIAKDWQAIGTDGQKSYRKIEIDAIVRTIAEC